MVFTRCANTHSNGDGDYGAADLIVETALVALRDSSPPMILGFILIVTTLLTSIMNNAATAAVMCPIAVSVSNQLGLNPDAFFNGGSGLELPVRS